MSGYAFWLIGDPSPQKSDLAKALHDRLSSQGNRVEVLDGSGGLGFVTASSDFSTGEWGGYALDAVHLSKILVRQDTCVIVPISGMSREAYAFARMELEGFVGAYIGPHTAYGTPVQPVEAALAAVATDGDGFSNHAAYQAEALGLFDVTIDPSITTVEEGVSLVLDVASRKGLVLRDDVVSSDEEVEVSILMPCLNEADAIGDCVAEAVGTLKTSGIRGEVVVVDNGSTDGSPDIAEAAGARVVREQRRGYGAAYLRGLKEARGQYLVMGDSDGTYDFSLVPEFLRRLREGHDFVNGSRIKGEMDRGAIPFLHRYVGVPVLTWVLNRLSGANFSDAHCGMRGFSREAAARMGLRSPGMEFASEMILQAARTNLRTAELPIRYRARKGDSKLRTFSDGWRHIRFMLLHSPTHLFVAPGAGLLALGLLMMLALVGGQLEVAGMVFDIHYMVVGSVLAIVGFQIASLGMSARMYALSIGIFRRDPLIDWGMRRLNLERGILIGAVVSVVGLGILAGIAAQWVAWDFSFQSEGMMRPALLGLTLVVLGAQTVFSSFFLSLLSMRFQRQQSASLN